MRFFGILTISILFCAQFLGCTIWVRHDEPARYSVKVLFSDERLKDVVFSGQSLLVMPVLTQSGPDTIKYPSPFALTQIIQNGHDEMRFIYPQAFEQKYQSNHDSVSLRRFYQSLFNGDVLKLQTSDSVWSAMDAAYLFCIRVKYAATIRGFDNMIVKKLVFEAELWDAAANETLWRVQVIGLDRRIEATDMQFVIGAFKEIFNIFPAGALGAGEKDW